ncbi:hypothetical protein ABZ092_23135 [Streptomyces bobili]|uniref:hypothetical protein n=1 Tax=Streptomyces bobili TaxID=67280 RepID=UPI0033AE62E6
MGLDITVPALDWTEWERTPRAEHQNLLCEAACPEDLPWDAARGGLDDPGVAAGALERAVRVPRHPGLLRTALPGGRTLGHRERVRRGWGLLGLPV